ncbi:ERMES complex subunit [Pyricularia oryzae]|uniref:Mitochondrial distribution and morphology protein 34 n=2 Tax=Pyricularia TaxID=48558 RepID=A0ABQ8NZ02_PYRGI|nr:ERMES complex subunit [Pyricularia oryzae]KAI6304183.1 ERMES complex subunit [Pyricularia grisea]KAH9429968.1 ERMES complex subunit [Pyricularia oryzae]KAI6262477.1 ERMES complex subunit [Pyricularia oryzae]KAI6274234.1 ERMES complex subunit [Pyricularia oryzae]
MAFNFNWSPLTADASFYKRARDLLTTALNKSPKPPIIVDDILVTEFNLGSVPPELEILEIGDLAEDRFRGIFKMTYSGDAFLTLKTRVQANPLNTYLYSKPSFTSPEPLAAASGLTIPLQITLSEIKLSAFIILVFSKQKGLTLVFRNDPLESLKVSSTFDSIQFVRDYLQRTIEGKLRNLMMDELPAIIHKLSLQLWCPEQMSKEDHEKTNEMDEQAVNPFASPPLDAVDAHGNLLDPIDISSIAVNGGAELQSLFSQKNLFRLGNLVNTQLTSSLFTPSVPEVIFRAKAGPVDKPEASSTTPLTTPSLVKSHSFHGTSTVYTFSDTSSQNNGQLPSRPSLVSLGSATTGLGLAASRNAKPYANRKKKTRVVNLRRKTDTAASSEMGDTMSDSASVQASESITMSDSIPEDPEEQSELTMSGSSRVRFGLGGERSALPQRPALRRDLFNPDEATASAEISQPQVARSTPEKETAAPVRTSENDKRSDSKRRGPRSETPSVILEQAWIMKMAGEIAKRVYDEKQRNPSFWDEREDSPPPAYEAQPTTAAS